MTERPNTKQAAPSSDEWSSAERLLAGVDEPLQNLDGVNFFRALEEAARLLGPAASTPALRRALDTCCAPSWSCGEAIRAACTESPSKVLYGVLRLSASVVQPTTPLGPRTVVGNFLHVWGQYFHRSIRPNGKVDEIRAKIWERLTSAGADPALRAVWEEILGTPAITAWVDLHDLKPQLRRQAELLGNIEVQVSWMDAVEAQQNRPQFRRIAPMIQAHILRLFLLPDGPAAGLAVLLACLVPLFRDSSRKITASTLDYFSDWLIAGLNRDRAADARLWHETKGSSRINQHLGIELVEHLGNGLDEETLQGYTESLRKLLRLLASIDGGWPPYSLTSTNRS